MRRLLLLGAMAGLLVATAPESAHGQEMDLIEVGEMAPDVSWTGATRHGVLQDQVHLSDYLGETVVLAFFFRVRTRG